MARSRQLASIMFTDIEGDTALMQQNEEKQSSPGINIDGYSIPLLAAFEA